MEELTVVQATHKRTRMNVSITAKGLAQWDVTAEYESPAEAAEQLEMAIGQVRGVIARAGLKEAGE